MTDARPLRSARGLVRVFALAWLGVPWAFSGPAGAVEPSPVRIVFVGDSLVNRSQQDHGLLDLVRQDLRRSRPELVPELVNAGVNGDCIADIRGRLARDVLAYRPAAVVLYWDSDAADVEAVGEVPGRARELREAYEANLEAVLQALTAATPRVLVAGPTLFGERTHGHNPKDHVLDAYAGINRRVCHRCHVTWIDTRAAAFRWLRENAAGDRRGTGRLTEDGEHLNAAGTALVSGEIAVALASRWETPAQKQPTEPAPPETDSEQ